MNSSLSPAKNGPPLFVSMDMTTVSGRGTHLRTGAASASETAAEPRRLDYASPRRKVRKPVPDVAFLFGWMGLLVGMYLLMSLLLAFLGGPLFVDIP